MRPLNLRACENGPSWDVINNFTTYSYNHSYTNNKFFPLQYHNIVKQKGKENKEKHDLSNCL